MPTPGASRAAGRADCFAAHKTDTIALACKRWRRSRRAVLRARAIAGRIAPADVTGTPGMAATGRVNKRGERTSA